MNSTDISQLSMSELKSMCASQAIAVIGDKRAKSTYILSIETFQSQQTVIEITETVAAIPDPAVELPVPAIELPLDESVPLLTTQPTAPTQHRGASASASIVIVVIATMLWGLFLLIATGLRSLIHLIAAVVRLSVRIWGFSNQEEVPTSFVLISSAQS